MPNNVAIYSGGIGGGNALKFAVKLPNFVILSLAIYFVIILITRVYIEK